ncbi:hypothetical protein DFH06DRAFT_1148784 [Mycena polygramma]|nr:hypothetical protein DFH06DRAFT_1148784 [Mycena polygramma]
MSNALQCLFFGSCLLTALLMSCYTASLTNPFDRLPPELRRGIFDIVVLATPETLVRNRTRACFICAAWKAFLESVPSYWTFTLVDSIIAPSSILRFIALAKSLPLEFRIVLTSDAVLSLTYLAPFLIRAVRLVIESDRADTLLRLRETFRGLSAPALTYFAASMHHIPNDYAQFVLPPLATPPWFYGPHKYLETLHLNCIPVPFMGLDFPRLLELSLSGRHYRYSVDAAQLGGLIANSPLLRSLAIRRLHCEGVLAPSVPLVIRSSSIEELELSFSYTNSTLLLASAFVFPALSKLTVDVMTMEDAAFLFGLPSATLSIVTTLVIRNRHMRADPFPFPSSALLMRFHNVTSLDLRRCCAWVFPELLSVASQYSASTGSKVLPCLASLTVNRVSLDDLISFVILYGACEGSDGSHSVLRRIRSSSCLCDYSFTTGIVANREWLTSHFLVLTLAQYVRPTHNPKTRLRYRSKFCFCSSDWMWFLMSIPELWTTIDIDKDISPAAVLRFIRSAGALPLKMCIVLDSDDPILGLEYLEPFMPRVSVLRIESDRAESVFRLRQTFWALSAPNARSFSVNLKRSPRSSMDPTPIINLPWFPGRAFRVEVMHLGFCTVVPFWDCVTFPALRRLCVWGMHHKYSATSAMLKSVVEKSPNLRLLTLRGFSCSGLFPDPPVITSSSVENLEVSWAHNDSMSLLLRTFVFPHLTNFTVDLCSQFHVQNLMAVPLPLLSTVTELKVLNPRRPDRSSEFTAITIFGMFPSLTVLDLSGSRPPLFVEFAEAACSFAAANPGVNLIPGLRSLVLSKADLHDITDLAILYGARSWRDGSDLNHVLNPKVVHGLQLTPLPSLNLGTTIARFPRHNTMNTKPLPLPFSARSLSFRYNGTVDWDISPVPSGQHGILVIAYYMTSYVAKFHQNASHLDVASCNRFRPPVTRPLRFFLSVGYGSFRSILGFANFFAASSLFDRIPNELRRVIFDDVLKSARSRLRLRSKICVCSSDWMEFVMSVPEYWQVIVVDSIIAPSSILRFIDLARALPLEFRIVLASSGPVLSLHYLSTFILRAVRLTVESDRMDTMLRLRQSFLGLSAPALTYFSVGLERQALSYAGNSASPPLTLPWFDGGHDSLEVLDLHCAAVPFTVLTFPRLHSLRIGGYHLFHPVAALVGAVIRGSPRLKVLTIENLHYTPEQPPATSLPILSFSIEELDLAFRDNHATQAAFLVSTFQFPSLTKLTVDVCHRRHVAEIRSLPAALLSAVTALVFRNSCRRFPPFVFLDTSILLRFSRVTSIDIRSSLPHVFDELLLSASHYKASAGVNLLPHLASLTIRGEPSEGILKFASLYGANVDHDGSDLVLRRIRAAACDCQEPAIDVLVTRSWLTAHLLDYAVDIFSFTRLFSAARLRK